MRPSRSTPRVRSRGPTTKAALRARPHSGRVWAQSPARRRARRAARLAVAVPASRSRPSPPGRRVIRSAAARSPATARSAARRSSASRWESGARWASSSATSSVVVSCSAAPNHVPSPMAMPRALSSARASSSFRMAARVRAFGPPWLPPQAPQSSEAAWALAAVVAPWPQSRTTGANPSVRPMVRSAVSATVARSSRPSASAGSTTVTAAASRPRRGEGATVRASAAGPNTHPAVSASAYMATAS